jgi:AhpD family alkylhydroperoxidase
MSSARVEYNKFLAIAQDANDALMAVGNTVHASGLDKRLNELTKVRASQINGCASCLQFHMNFARDAGVPAKQLDLVAVWEDASVFNDRERAALAWTELLTRISPGAVTDGDFAAVSEHFSEEEVVFLTINIASINAWNRVGAALKFTPTKSNAPG